jgi:hypothetical protein
MELGVDKNLKEIKKFIISEMKKESADWVESNGDYGSKFVKFKATRELHIDKVYFILKRNRVYDTRFELSEIGLSKFRYNYLLNRYVKKFIKNADIIKRKKFIANEWNEFIGENKDLNRDRKLEEIGI